MKKKNVIWFMTDQLRGCALGINGDPNVRTPNIDTLALQGVNFKNAVSGYPLCCPYRGSLITGKYPQNNGVIGHEYPLPTKCETIADIFNKENYDTIYLGKWHLDGFYESEGPSRYHIVPRERRGRFNTWIGYDNNNSPYDCYVHGHENDKEVELFRLPKFETTSLTDMAISRIKTMDENQPFFMVISVQAPHDPFVGTPENMKNRNAQDVKLRPNVPPYENVQARAKIDLAGYYASIESVDDNVGRLVEALREKGIDRDTHIIFLSDHGEMAGSHGFQRKTNPFEESIKVPFIIGGEIHHGYRDANEKNNQTRKCGSTNVLINHVDILPTTLGLCDIEIPKWAEGQDFSGYRVGGKNRPEPKSAFIQNIIPTKHGDSIDKPYRGIVTADGYKYVCLENTEWLLYNLNEDPYELTNLAHNSIFKDLRVRLNKELQEWIVKTNDKFDLPDSNSF